MSGVEPAPRIGRTLKGKYLLQELLGEGGMGEVYRARNTLLDRTVAIKLLRAEVAKDKRVIERFMREAKAANVVRHKHIVDVLDIDQDEAGAFFIVQEYLEGEDLAMRLEDAEQPMSPEQALEVVIPVAGAVGAAHAKGVVHRDLKPDNIFLAQIGGEMVPKVLDFGISKMPLHQELRKLSQTGEAASGNVKLTAAGAAMGTPAYMSPEQIRDPATVDARTDVWSLGVILYEAMSGQLPFDADNLAQLFAEICTRDPVPLDRAARGVPKALVKVVRKCLNPVATARFANAGELADALQRCLAAILDPSTTTTSSAPPGASSRRPQQSSAPTAIGGSRPPHSSTSPGTDEVRQSGERPMAFQQTEPAKRSSSKPPSGALPKLELDLPRQPGGSSSMPPRRDSVSPGRWEIEVPPTDSPTSGSTPAPRSPPPADSNAPTAIPAGPRSGAPQPPRSTAPPSGQTSGEFDAFDFDDDERAAVIFALDDNDGPARKAPAHRAARTARGRSAPSAAPPRSTGGRARLSRRAPARGVRIEAVRFGLGCLLVIAIGVASHYLSPAPLAQVVGRLGAHAFAPYLVAASLLLFATLWTLVRAAKMVSFFLFAAALGQLVLVAAALAAASLMAAPGLLGDTIHLVALLGASWAAIVVPAGYGAFALMRARELRGDGGGRNTALALHLAAALGAAVLVVVTATRPRPSPQQILELRPGSIEAGVTKQIRRMALAALGARAFVALPVTSAPAPSTRGASAVARVADTKSK